MTEPQGRRHLVDEFERIGARRVVNGVGPATRLGGVPLHPSVVAAMSGATAAAVRMDELEEAAGRHLASLLGVEAAYVTSGASAALTLATAALIGGSDAALLDALPRISGSANRVVVLAAHRDPYDRAVEAAGAQLVTVGYPHSTHIGEIERELPDAAAVLYRPRRPGNHPSLAQIARSAAMRGVPVVIDGALHAPPVENLHRWLSDGAALVALSGGKHFRGPQATGILCGRADLVELAGLQHQDMDEREATWPYARRRGESSTPPRHGLGRGMKVGREQIAGLLAAVERYVDQPGVDDVPGIEELGRLEALLADLPIGVRREPTSALGVPTLALHIDGARWDTDAVVNRLRSFETPIFLEESEVWRDVLVINPMALVNGDAELIAAALTQALAEPERTDSKGRQT